MCTVTLQRLRTSLKKTKTPYCILEISIISLELKFHRNSIGYLSSGQTNKYVLWLKKDLRGSKISMATLAQQRQCWLYIKAPQTHIRPQRRLDVTN